MSDEEEIQEDAPETLIDIIDRQLEILLQLNEVDHSALYDDWNEQKIKVLSMAMKIINRAQTQLFKDLK